MDAGLVAVLELTVEMAVAGRGLGALAKPRTEDDEGRADRGLVRGTTFEAAAGFIGFEAGS